MGIPTKLTIAMSAVVVLFSTTAQAQLANTTPEVQKAIQVLKTACAENPKSDKSSRACADVGVARGASRPDSETSCKMRDNWCSVVLSR